MIGLIIFAIISFVIIWYMVYKILLKINDKRPTKKILDKLERQEQRFTQEGKSSNFKDILQMGLKEAGLSPKKEVINTHQTENLEDKTAITDINKPEENKEDGK